MITTRRVAVLASVVSLLGVSACGGGHSASQTGVSPPRTVAPNGQAAGSTSTSARSGTAPAASVLASANANCRTFLSQIQKLGNGVLAGSASEIERRINQMVVKPSVPLLETLAKRQQALESAANSAQYDAYANMFDPIIVLAKQRVQAGEAGNLAQSTQLEGLLRSAGLEEEQAASRAGLSDCAVDFERALSSSFRG